MPRQALAERRLFLLLSITAALAFYYLRVGSLPELYLIPLKGAAVALLALYARVRHSSSDAHLLALALVAASLGDMGIEFDRRIGGLLFFLFHVLAMGVFLQHRRGPPNTGMTGRDSWICGVTLLATPVIGWLLPHDRALGWETGLYALALGGMAASAWASDFPRAKVGAGAFLFLAADLLLLAELGPLSGSEVAQYMVWPIYYLGVFLITVGVIQTLRKRAPELRVASSRE